ncbi:MAG: TPM domain-containing protein [Rhizomicrobium sp.]
MLAGIVSLVWLTLSHAYAAPAFPALTGRVVDEAGVLSDDTKRELDGILAGDQQHFAGRQIVVATLKSLQGYEISDYGYQLGRAWGIGQKGKNNGALIIVAPNEHKVRIEVGYGLEGDLTDAQSRVIIDQYMLPAFKKGDYNAGVLEGTKAVLATLGNKNFAAPDYDRIRDDEQAPSGWSTALIVFVLIFFFAGRSWFWPLFFLGGMGGRGGWGGGGFGGGGWSGGGGGVASPVAADRLAAGARQAVGRCTAYIE